MWPEGRFCSGVGFWRTVDFSEFEELAEAGVEGEFGVGGIILSAWDKPCFHHRTALQTGKLVRFEHTWICSSKMPLVRL